MGTFMALRKPLWAAKHHCTVAQMRLSEAEGNFQPPDGQFTIYKKSIILIIFTNINLRFNFYSKLCTNYSSLSIFLLWESEESFQEDFQDYFSLVNEKDSCQW